MPKLKGNQPIPKSKKAITNSEASELKSAHAPGQAHVFAIRFTDEKFVHYEDYSERLDFYRQRVFNCRHTGKGSLTYEEAYTTEFHTEHLLRSFPAVFSDEVARLVHGNQQSLEALSKSILDFLSKRYIIGEIVLVSKKHLGGKTEDKEECKVEKWVEKSSTLQVSFKGSSKNQSVPTIESERKSFAQLTTEVIAAKIETIASKGKFQKAPWILHSHILDSLKDAPKLSKASQDAISKKEPLQSKKRKREEETEVTEEPPAKRKAADSGSKKLTSAKASSSPGTASNDSKSAATKKAESKPKKADSSDKKKGKQSKKKSSGTVAASHIDESDDEDSYMSNDEDNHTSSDREDDDSGSEDSDSDDGKSKRSKKIEPTKSKYPMEDLEIERQYVDPPSEDSMELVNASSVSNSTATHVASSKPLEQDETSKMDLDQIEHYNAQVKKPFNYKSARLPPRPASDFLVPQASLGDLLQVCNFIGTFYEILFITPFPAEDLAMALDYPKPCNLIGEVHFRLLRHLSAHYQWLPKMSAKSWEANLAQYMYAKRHVFGHLVLISTLQTQGYYALSLAQKLKILVFLVEMNSGIKYLEDKVNQILEKKSNLEKKSYENRSKLRKKYKDSHLPKDTEAAEKTSTDTNTSSGVTTKGEKMTSGVLKALLEEENLRHQNEMNQLPSIRIKPLGQDRYFNTYWWFGKNSSKKDPGVVISSLEAFVLVEYAEGNIDFGDDPSARHYLDGYESDYEARKHVRRQWRIDHAKKTAAKDDGSPDGSEDEGSEEITQQQSSSKSKKERNGKEGDDDDDAVEYDHRGRPKRKAKAKLEDEDEDESPRARQVTRSQCGICTSSAQMHKMILCDECDQAYHMYCLNPPLTRIPYSLWKCPKCLGQKLPPPSVHIPSSLPTRSRFREQTNPELQESVAKKNGNGSGAFESQDKSSSPSKMDISFSTSTKLENGTDSDQMVIDSKDTESVAAMDLDILTDSDEDYPETLSLVRGGTTYMPKKVAIRWGYYENEEELEQLLQWLDDRGIREKQLKARLKEKLPKITELMAKRAQQLRKIAIPDELPIRRVTRFGNAEKKKELMLPFMSYTNKYADTTR